MSNSILFANTYFYRFDEKQWKMQKPYPPYNTILAAAIMREKGFEVGLFDANLKQNPLEIENKIIAFQPRYLVIYDDSFNYLSKMCLNVMREACFEMIKVAKKHGCIILVNSSDATDHFEKYLEVGADFVLLGEAEQTLQELFQHNFENCHNINGIAFLENSEIVKTHKRPIFQELDKYPMPAWDLINLVDYQAIWLKKHGYFSLNIATTRGCPYKCNWCAKPIYGNRYNSRSPQKIADELAFLIEKGATHFWVCDDIFGLKPNWVNEFRVYLGGKGVKPKLKIQSRADLLLKENTIDDLVACGLDEVWIGAESGSQKVLDAMDKGITVEEIEKSAKLLKEKGVKVAFFLQYGYLNETWEDIEMTLSMVKKLLPDDLGISVSYPLPGTGFYEKVKNQLVNKQNWDDSDDLAMMYRGTFSPVFYRQLHDYTHRLYRRAKALKNRHLNYPLLWIREKMSYQKLIELRKIER
jgi:anaerobic magnesium-protoporphyrin IX monomethyl ester cyclase